MPRFSLRRITVILAGLALAPLVSVSARAQSQSLITLAPAEEAAAVRGRDQRAETIDPEVRTKAQAESTVPVFIVLTQQPQREILERANATSVLKNQAADFKYRQQLQAAFADPEEVRRAREGLDAITLEMRQEAFREIETEIGPQQDAVESRLRGLGATRIGRYKGINMLTAEIPSGALAQLEADPAIARVWPVGQLQALIVNSVPAMGAPTFWANGYTGAGESVAVLDSGVRTNHPAFAGKTINSQVFLTYGSTDPCFADNASSFQDQMGHGTHVAGIVASQGSMEGNHDWTHYQGVAKGINTLYNVKIGYLLLPTQNCAGTTQVKLAVADLRDITQALDWIVTSTPASVINLSYGTPATQYDDPGAQVFDYYADTYDLSVAIAAGNSGTDFPNVSTPSIAFNVLSVGNWDTGGLANNSHEVMNPTSSIGPAPQGQFKPDLAAPGTNIYSAAYDWDGNGGANPDYVQHTGTSMASPHVAGALALLRSSLPSNGQAGPLARAILVNTADMPAASPFWQKDSGWGYLNLTTAWSQRSLYDIVTLGGSSGAPAYKLYKVPLTGQRLKITAAWNRHLSGYSVDPTGAPTFTGSGLNALVLTPYDPAANTILGSGTPNWMGGINQMSLDLTAPHPSNALVTAVWNKGTSGTQDQFAIAFSSGFTAVAGPSLQLSCDLPPVLYVGMQFTLTCTPSNTGDLTAFHVGEGYGWPPGMGGEGPIFGDLQPGQTGTPGVIGYLLVPTVAGDYPLEVNLSSQSYGLNFGPDIQLTVHAAPNPDWGPWLGCAGPGSVPAGSGGVHVVMTGENLFPNATAYWNGTALATTFVNTMELGATVPASLLGTATTATITVTNPTGPRSVVRNIEVRPVLPQPAGTIDTFAGGANMCYSGQNIDGNPATAVQFGGLSGLAADNAGNVYLADGNMIWKVTSNGIISTFAGSSTAGYSGDSGPATSALLKNPFALAVDKGGNVYIADNGNYVIRKVDSSGIITTYAGNNVNGYSGDGGLATSASLSGVAGMAVDGAGNLYFSDPSNIRVRMVSPQGTISTIAGNGTIGSTPATAAVRRARRWRGPMASRWMRLATSTSSTAGTE